jgi:hypothetical protein
LRAARPRAARPNSAKPAGAGTGTPPVELLVLELVELLVLELVELLDELGPQLCGRQALAGDEIESAARARVPVAASLRIRVFIAFLLQSLSGWRSALPKLRTGQVNAILERSHIQRRLRNARPDLKRRCAMRYRRQDTGRGAVIVGLVYKGLPLNHRSSRFSAAGAHLAFALAC